MDGKVTAKNNKKASRNNCAGEELRGKRREREGKKTSSCTGDWGVEGAGSDEMRPRPTITLIKYFKVE